MACIFCAARSMLRCALPVPVVRARLLDRARCCEDACLHMTVHVLPGLLECARIPGRLYLTGISRILSSEVRGWPDCLLVHALHLRSLKELANGTTANYRPRTTQAIPPPSHSYITRRRRQSRHWTRRRCLRREHGRAHRCSRNDRNARWDENSFQLRERL